MMSIKNYERLEEVIRWSGMSIHAFAIKIGLERSENLYRILRTKENVSLKLITRIIKTYPEINRDWFIYGDGEMMIEKKDEYNDSSKIPFCDQLNGTASYFLNMPMFKGADLATNRTDRAMEPMIPVGSTIVLKKQSVTMVVYGKIYYVETDDWSMIRIIRKNNLSDDEFVLEAVDVKNYDSMTIRKDEIRNLHLVCGIVNVFS